MPKSVGAKRLEKKGFKLPKNDHQANAMATRIYQSVAKVRAQGSDVRARLRAAELLKIEDTRAAIEGGDKAAQHELTDIYEGNLEKWMDMVLEDSDVESEEPTTE